MSTIKTILQSLSLLAASVVFLFWWFQRSLLYHPSHYEPKRQHFYANDFSRIPLKTSDGLDLYAWYKKPTTEPITVVVFHGNAGHVGKRMPLARALVNKGFGVMLMSYRGYGGNPGKPTENGFYSDARAAMNYLQENKACVVIYGESLGTGVATKMAAEYPSASVVLQSPFKSVVDMAAIRYPWLSFIEPVDKYHSDKRINAFSAPLLVIHGTHDRIVPYSQGEGLYHLRKKDKTLWTYPGYHHGNLWEKAFYQRLTHFLVKQHC